MLKKILAILMVVAMVFSLAACGGGGDASTSEGGTTESTGGEDTPESEDTGGEDAQAGADALTIWCWDPNFNLYAMEEATKVYQQENPDFTVDIQEVPWDDIQTRIIAAATANDYSTLPDIFLCQNNAYQKNVINYPNIFTDLTNVGIDFSQFAAGATGYSTVDGMNYGVPFDNGATVFAVRTDILAEAGLTLADFENIDWDTFIDLGVQVKDATGTPLIGVEAGGSDLVIMMLKTAGVSFFNEDGSVNIAGNETLVEAVNTYKAAIDAGVIAEYTSGDEVNGAFVSGGTAGVINGCWILGTVQTSEDTAGNWGVANFPSLTNVADSVPYSENGGSSWAVVAGKENTELAIDFLNKTYAGSVEFYETILQSAGALPNWIPASESEIYSEPLDFFGGQAVYADIVEYASNVKPFNTGVYYYEATDAVGTAVTNIINGGDVEAELQAAQDQVEFDIG